MPNFCPNCAATLDPDAKFCPSCSSPIAYANPGASQMPYGGGMAPGMQRPAAGGFNMGGAMAGAKVEPLIWAGIISLFWAAWFFSNFAGMGGTMNLLGAASGVRGGADSDTAAIFFMISYAFSVAAFAVLAMVAYGVFTKKRWAYSLFMISVGPIALIWLILGLVTFFTSGSKPAGIVIIYILGMLTGLALFGLQAMLLMKHRNQLTN
jgi:hypothetical protein